MVECTSLNIYARLPAAELTPATTYAAYLVYGVVKGRRGLSYPDQETTVALGGGRVAPARKFRAVSRGTGDEEREDGWSEMGWYLKHGLIVEGVEFRPVN